MSTDNIVGTDTGVDFRSVRDFIEAEDTQGVEGTEAPESAEGALDAGDPDSESLERPNEKAKEVGSPQATPSDDALEGEDSAETGTHSDDATQPTDSVDDYIVAKHNDKEIRIPKDAKLQVKVDKQLRELTIDEATKELSGVLNYKAANSALGRDKAQFTRDREEFRRYAETVATNAEILIESEDPIELCTQFAILKGEDPNKVWDSLVDKVVEYIDTYKNMTPHERELLAENRRLKLGQRQHQKQQDTTSKQETAQREREALSKALEKEGFTIDEFVSTLTELTNRNDNNEELEYGLSELEKITEDDIIHYMIAKDLNSRVESGIKEVDSKLLQDTTFVDRVVKALARTEALHGKLTTAEVAKFVRSAWTIDNKHLSKNLSKAAATAPKPESVRLQEEDDDDDEGPGSIYEYLNRQR